MIEGFLWLLFIMKFLDIFFLCFYIKVDIELGICCIVEIDMIIYVIGIVVLSFDLDLFVII